MYSKKINVNYHNFEATDDDYYTNLQNTFETILKSGDTSGSLDSGETHFLWKINGTERVTDTTTFFISLVKGKAILPVWFNDSGDIREVTANGGYIGDLYYAFINPIKKFMISFSATSGNAAGHFKRLLNEFSLNGGVKITPVYEQEIVKKVLLWDYYKKINASLNFTTYDDLAEFKTTKEGSQLGLVDTLGGLKIDFTICATISKQVLDSIEVRGVIRNLLANDFCQKLVIRGADFETEALEEIDILNSKIKYSESVNITGMYLSEVEAADVLRRALFDKTKTGALI